jgi:flagellar biogenesis protein FliO
LVSNYIRAARIENFYNFMIVPQEELNLLKKQKNKRDLIIFLIVVGLIGFIAWFIYKIVKRSKSTKIVVQ